jgi:6-phosphofructokinase 2
MNTNGFNAPQPPAHPPTVAYSQHSSHPHAAHTSVQELHVPDILTLTLNPALDIASSIDRLVPDHKLRCEAPRMDAGGGGVNVARVASRLGARALALCAVGGPTGGEFQRLLQAEGVAGAYVPIAGSTRESFTVLETSSGREYRFVLPGPQWPQAQWQQWLERCVDLAASARFVVASGSLPPGVPDDAYAQLARRLGPGARLVLDASGPALEAALQAGVHGIKPSLRELQQLTGRPLSSAPEQLDACRRIVEAGSAAWVALSLGAEGALLVTAQGAWRAPGVAVKAVTTIGAGDAFVAGLLVALARGAAPDAALRSAMAASSVAVQSRGTAQCDPQAFTAMLDRVVVEPV